MIRPLRDRLLVKPLDEPLSTVLEVIHDSKGKHSRGEVLAVGPSVKFDEDRFRPRQECDVQPGDLIHFTDIFKFPVVEDQGQKLLMLQEADVCFIEEAA